MSAEINNRITWGVIIVAIVVLIYLKTCSSNIKDPVRSTKRSSKQKPIKVSLHTNPMCRYCKEFLPEWKKIVAHYKKSKNITLEHIDCSTRTGSKVCSLRKIRAVPTIIVKTGTKPVVYTGDRTSEAIIDHINSL